jgi:hypothetical protein
VSRPAARARTIAGVGLLAAAEVPWAALPLGGSTAFLRLVLACAVLAAMMSVARLANTAAADGDRRRLDGYDWPGSGAWLWLTALPGRLRWAEVLAVAVIVLEALHPARPWHTVVLIFLLFWFLLAYHLAESDATRVVLGPQLPLLLAGGGLAVLCAAAAALPGAWAGAGWLAVLSGVAAVVAAGLALPV